VHRGCAFQRCERGLAWGRGLARDDDEFDFDEDDDEEDEFDDDEDDEEDAGTPVTPVDGLGGGRR